MSGIMWANDDDDSGGGGGGSVPFPFPMAQEDDEEEEYTRSPLPPNTTSSTAAAAATETNPAPAPALASASAPVEEIGEATFTLLEAAAYAMPFPDFCDRLEATGRAKGPTGKVEAFFFAGGFRARLEGKHHALTPAGGPRTPSLYPLFRLLLPQNDPRAGQYKLNTAMLGQQYAGALCLKKDLDDYKLLTEFTKPEHSKHAKVADVADAIMEVVRKRVSVPGNRSALTLRDVNNVLDEIVSTRTDQKAKRAIFVRIIDQLPAREHKWLARIICGDLKIGLKKDSALKVFGEDGPQRLDAVHDLRRLCAEVALGVNAGSHIVLMTPFEVHLAKRVRNPSKALEEMGGQAFVMERKVDGERYCIHKRGDNVKLISRNLRDAKIEYYTHFSNTFTQYIAAEECVIDGEVVAVNTRTGEHEDFGHNKTVEAARRAAGIAPGGEGGGIDRGESAASAGAGGVLANNGVMINPTSHELIYVAFDVVYLGGKGAAEVFAKAGLQPCAPHEVCKLPLHQRRDLLVALIKPKRHRLELIEQREVAAAEEAGVRGAMIAKHEAVDKGWEGLVLKRLNGPYQTGKKSREVGGWVKLKPDYAEETEEMDLVLVGARYGEGKARGIASLLLGIIAEEQPADDDGGNDMDVKAADDDDEEGGGVGRGASAASALSQPTTSQRGRGKWPAYTGCNSQGRRFRFHSFARVSARHLKDQDRATFLASLEDHWEDGGQARGVPPWMMPWKPNKDDHPDRWLHPDFMVVISVKAAEIYASKSYSLGFTLRFPRMTRLRPDKGVPDAMDHDEFRALRARPLNSLQTAAQAQAANAAAANGAWSEGGGAGGKKKRGGGGGRAKTARAVIGALPEGVEKGDGGSGVFEGLEAAIVRGAYRTSHPKAAEYLGKKKPGPPPAKARSAAASSSAVLSTPATAPALEVTRDDVYRLFVKHGGRVVNNPTERQDPSPDSSQEQEEEDKEKGGGGGGTVQRGQKKRKRGDGEGEGGCCEGSILAGVGVGSGKRGKTKTKKRVLKQDFFIGPSDNSEPLRVLVAGWDADFYTLDWLLDCIQADRRIVPKVEHLLAWTAATERRLRQSADCYGDPLAEEGDVGELKKVLARFHTSKGLAALVSDMLWRACAELHLVEAEERGVLGKYNLFWRPNWVFYLDRYADPGPPDPSSTTDDPNGDDHRPLRFTTLDATAMLLRLHGATVAPTLHADVTTVIVDKRCPQRFPLLKARLDELRGMPWEAEEKVVVDRAWVEECAEQCCILDKEQRHFVSLAAPRVATTIDEEEEEEGD